MAKAAVLWEKRALINAQVRTCLAVTPVMSGGGAGAAVSEEQMCWFVLPEAGQLGTGGRVETLTHSDTGKPGHVYVPTRQVERNLNVYLKLCRTVCISFNKINFLRTGRSTKEY